MSKAADTAKQWLSDLVRTANLSEDQRKALETTISAPEALEFIGGSVLRQADYDRNMNQNKSQYTAELQKIQKYERELADWRGKTESQYQMVAAQLAQAQAEAQRIRQVAYSYNLTDEDLGQPVAPHTTPVGTPAVNVADTTVNNKDEYLKRADFESAAALHTLLPAAVNDIVAEHIELFGKHPKGMQQVVERAVKEQRPIKDVWEETFEVGEKRAELEKARIDAEINRRVQEQVTAYRTEHSIPVPRPDGQRSLILSNRDTLTMPEDTTGVQKHNDSVSAAVAAWNQMAHKNLGD